MNNKDLTADYIVSLLNKIILMLAPLITTPYLARILGAEGIGIYSYTHAIAECFILFGLLGIETYGNREVAYARDNKYQRSKIFVEIMILKCITLGIAILIYAIFFSTDAEYGIYYRILIVEMVANLIDISWYLHGLEKVKVVALKGILVKLTGIICVFLFVKEENHLARYIIIYAVTTIIGNFALWIYMIKNNQLIKFKDIEIKKHLKPSFQFFIPQIAIEIYSVIDKTMLGTLIISKAEVGYYEQAQKIINLLVQLSTSLEIVIVPRIAYTFAHGSKEELRDYIYKSFNFVILLACPIMFGVASISKQIVNVFLGEEFYETTLIVNMMMPLVLIIGLSNVIGYQYLTTTKQQNKFSIIVISSIIINVILNLILIPIFEALGVAISSVFAELFMLGFGIYYVKKEIHFLEVIKMFKNYLITSVIIFIINRIIVYFIPNEIIVIPTCIIVSILVYSGLLIFLFKDKYLMEKINMVKNKYLSKHA